jgi:hypothetical protein
MTATTLQAFREIHSAMQTQPTNWQWIGQHMSQQMFGITEARAKDYALHYGGEASQTMEILRSFDATYLSGGDK